MAQSKMERQMQTFKDWVKVNNGHDVAGIMKYVADDIELSSSMRQEAHNKKEAAEFWESLFKTFPDIKVEPYSYTCDGNTIFVESFMQGTMKGKMGDVEPTNKTWRIRAAFRFDFNEDAKISKLCSFYDRCSIMLHLYHKLGEQS